MSYSSEYKQQVLESLDRASPLLQELQEGRISEHLPGVFQSVITASRLEDHTEIATFAEHIKNAVESLLSEGSFPNNEIRTTINNAVTEIKDCLNDKRQTLDPALVQKLKSILRDATHDDRDYVVTKMIKVLYIDEDKFAQFNVKKTVDKSIQIESCFSGKDALSLLNNQGFDAILCELKLPDMNAFDIFKEYASKIPIVAISSSEDPKLIRLATKAGAVDFIVKNHTGIRRIARSLHTVTSELRKRAHLSQRKLLLDKPYVKKILKQMIETKAPIKQQITSKIVYDQKVDEAIRDHSVLESLVETGFVIKEPTELTLSCSKCKSMNIAIHYRCQNCSNSNFIRSNVLEHTRCGHTDLEQNFESADNRLVCPKCKKELKVIGVDYFKIESACKCKDCNNVFTMPVQQYSCADCGNSNFKISDANWTQLFNYTLNLSRIAELKQEILSLESIRDFLVEKGFDAHLDHQIEIKNQTCGPFDLVARKQDLHIFAITLGSGLEENFTRLIELDAVGKIIDGRIGKFVIMFSDPPEVTRNLMAKLGVASVIAEDESKLLGKFKEVLQGHKSYQLSPDTAVFTNEIIPR
jgi:CheY-like chemotaxis protein/Zn finger protein HypA/HybF involved in hydrogenase expression